MTIPHHDTDGAGSAYARLILGPAILENRLYNVRDILAVDHDAARTALPACRALIAARGTP
jgi:hypothetical protein